MCTRRMVNHVKQIQDFVSTDTARRRMAHVKKFGAKDRKAAIKCATLSSTY